MNTRLFITLLLLLVVHHFLTAQDTSRVDFRIDADVARFFGGDSLTYIELYYGISEAALTYRPDSSGYRGGIDLEITVSDSLRTVYERAWSIPRVLKDAGELVSPRNILSVETLGLPDGSYTAVLRCTDVFDRGRRDSVSIPIDVRGFADDEETLSDIELATVIRPSNRKESIFFKNTLEVVPNPSRLYGRGLPVLYFYAELYNMLADGGGNILFRASILDRSGKEIVSQTKDKPRKFDSSVEYGSMDVSSLPVGSYTFTIALLDTTAEPDRLLSSMEKKFFVFQPVLPAVSAGASQQDANNNLFGFMTETEAEREIDYLRYITNDFDKKQIEQLTDLAAKRNFLKSFWGKRASALSLTVDETRNDYLRRISYASDMYRERNREGWKTDRGRVSVLYGKPDEIERFPSPSESAPYEIWHYNAIQGGVIFVFVDRMGFGAYRLVHSTHLNELRNENWYEDEARIR